MAKKSGPVIDLTHGLCLRNLILFSDFASLLSSQNCTDLLGRKVSYKVREGLCCSWEVAAIFKGGYREPDSGNPHQLWVV